jgi:hypothetical protein
MVLQNEQKLKKKDRKETFLNLFNRQNWESTKWKMYPTN